MVIGGQWVTWHTVSENVWHICNIYLVHDTVIYGMTLRHMWLPSVHHTLDRTGTVSSVYKRHPGVWGRCRSPCSQPTGIWKKVYGGRGKWAHKWVTHTSHHPQLAQYIMNSYTIQYTKYTPTQCTRSTTIESIHHTINKYTLYIAIWCTMHPII